MRRVLACVAILAATLTPTSAAGVAAGVAPGKVPIADPVCRSLLALPAAAEIDIADQIMLGHVDLGQYGTFKLRPDPNWKPQSTLDLAGNRYQNSLNWALPLLQVGTSLDPSAGRPYIRRFVALLRDWEHDNRPGTRDYWADHPQYGGFRLATFVCAVRGLHDDPAVQWLRRTTRKEMRIQLGKFSIGGANNTMLNSAAAAFAAAVEVGTDDEVDVARRHIRHLIPQLVHPDGSDTEGSPGYGLYLLAIVNRTASMLRTYGAAGIADDLDAYVMNAAAFMAQATRPDRQLETWGDTQLRTIPQALFPADSDSGWVVGLSATPPVALYSRWRAGYVFGRSSWVDGVDESSTFYSMRTGETTPNTAHRHSDTTAITYYSQGVSWVAAPGPYRYDTSSLRWWVRGRAAHSALLTSGTPAFVAPTRVIESSSKHGIDTTCVRDPAYERSAHVQLVRCLYYVRGLHALIVRDFARPTSIHVTSQLIAPQFVLPPEVTDVAISGSSAQLSARTASGLDRSLLVQSSASLELANRAAPFGGLGRHYGVAERGTVLRTPWTARVGYTTSTATMLGPTAVSIETDGGQLVVSDGVREVVVAQSFTRFGTPRAHVSTVASPTIGRLHLHGVVSAAGRRLAAVPVVLQERIDGGWRERRTLQTRQSGRYDLTILRARHHHRIFRLAVAGQSGHPGWHENRSHRIVVSKVVKHRHGHRNR